MYLEARKISLIEEVLKVNSNETLDALETVLKAAEGKKAGKKNKSGIHDFVGILTKKEAVDIMNAIEETCEIVHPDDWK